LNYFPAFIKLDNKKILIIGGGNIAKEKLEKLLDFTNNIALISLEFCDDIKKIINTHSLKYYQNRYKKGFIKDYDIVIVALNDINLQKSIYKESRDYKVLFNAVDLPEFCDFIFPSYIKKGDFTVAISTSGTSPAFAKQFRIFLENIIPSDIEEFLKEMKNLRNTLPKGTKRMKLLEKKAKEYITHLLD